MKNHIIFAIILSISLLSCEKFLEPGKLNNLYEEDIVANPGFTEGILIYAYSRGLPNNYSFNYDVVSDDAVTNIIESSYRNMATGAWTSRFYPGSPWKNAYTSISYINKFLDIYLQTKYAVDIRNSPENNAIRDSLHKQRLKGEAHALRAYFKLELLKYHSGKTSDGTLMGFPIINKILLDTDDWKLPRNTFAECVNSIMEDLDIAIENLPPTYEDKPNDLNWNSTMGGAYMNRINGNTAILLKSRVALLAASPAFSESNAATWDDAAQIAASLLKELGALEPNGHINFYRQTKNKEIIWNFSEVLKRDWEQSNFPPSLLGNGNTNPSQNLVDAFPMRNGYPINHPSSNYNPNDPYADRDLRLGHYIIYNGANFSNSIINTYVGAAFNGINQLVTSTRTGYYLKKFMDPQVTLSPTNPINTPHTYTLARMTELLLNYAEAANEAWGPDGDPNGYGFTARSKIGELRNRAGILAPDSYLEEITSKDDMRALIKNERRLELCFEEFRFWDLRRWKDIEIMKESVKGVNITQDENENLIYEYIEIEPRIYPDYAIYGPIPYNETRKYSIGQNDGW